MCTANVEPLRQYPVHDRAKPLNDSSVLLSRREAKRSLLLIVAARREFGSVPVQNLQDLEVAVRSCEVGRRQPSSQSEWCGK